MPSSRAVATSSSRSAAGMIAPVGLAGLAKSTPFSGFSACAAATCAAVRWPAAASLDLDHLDAERGKDVAVGGIAGRRHRDPVADIEHGEEGEVERRRGAGRHRDPLRRNLDAVVLVVVRGDRLAQAASPSASV